MHFYTFDEWLANAYYSEDNSSIPKGSSKVINLTSEYPDARYLHIWSCWRTPKFISTVGSDPTIVPTIPEIKSEFGCLYELNYYNEDLDPADINYNVPVPEGHEHDVYKYRVNYRSNRGALQALGRKLGSIARPPFIFLFGNLVTGVVATWYDQNEDYNKQLMTINISQSENIQKILLYQILTEGAIAFEDATTCLELCFSNNPNASLDDDIDYRLRTNAHSSDSLMVVAAQLTFDSVGSSRYLIIDNLSQFVYGRVDMDHEFDVNILWRSVNTVTDEIQGA